MFSFRSPAAPPPKTKFQRVREKTWYICCSYKIGCSVWMLLLFGLTVLYLRDNYTNISVTNITSFIPSSFGGSSTTISSRDFSSRASLEVSYLNPLSYESVGYGTCPYKSPTYPNIGPDISYICASDKQYRAGVLWYIQKDIDSTDKIDEFFKKTDLIKEIIRNNTNSNGNNSTNKDLQISLKKTSGAHLMYQYISCQSEKDIKTLKNEWNNIIKDDEYEDIFNEFGYKSWKDIEICFDRVLCVNDNYFGGYSFNLYLDDKSQNMMKKLITKTEEIEEEKYSIDLTFKRVQHQQAFHITLASITNTADYDSFDAKQLMDKINNEIKGKLPCIKLGISPPFKNEWCYNSKKLKEKSLKFQWKCAEIQ